MGTQVEIDTLALLEVSLPATDSASASRGGDLPTPGACIGGGGKRTIDIIVALAALVLLAMPMLMVALLIRLTMGGPVIFRHVRVGLSGTPFNCLKFRTMISDSEVALARHLAENPEAALEWQQSRKLRKDPRVTWLRRAPAIVQCPEGGDELRRPPPHYCRRTGSLWTRGGKIPQGSPGPYGTLAGQRPQQSVLCRSCHA